MKRRLLKIMAGLAVGIAVALVGAWTAVGYMSTKGIEEPEYSVVGRGGAMRSGNTPRTSAPK